MNLTPDPPVSCGREFILNPILIHPFSVRLSIAGGLNGNRKEQSGSYLSGLSTELVGDLRWEPVVVLLARRPPSERYRTGLPAQHHAVTCTHIIIIRVFCNTLYSLPHHQGDPRERRKWKLWILQKLCERSSLRQCPQTLDILCRHVNNCVL